MKLTDAQLIFSLAPSYTPPSEIEQVKIDWPTDTWLSRRKKELALTANSASSNGNSHEEK